jgi:hypothetical protein
MKRNIWILFAVFLSINSAFSQRFPVYRDTINVATMQFEQSHFAFGVLTQGQRVSHTYVFKNTGKVPLVISNVLVTCGCTVPEWPKEPIQKGETGNIRIFFNTAGKQGNQNKNITILANTKHGRETLVFSANIITPPKK